MPTTLQVRITPEEMIQAVKKMKKKERDAFLEDLLAATSPDYLKSIRDARASSCFRGRPVAFITPLK